MKLTVSPDPALKSTDSVNLSLMDRPWRWSGCSRVPANRTHQKNILEAGMVVTVEPGVYIPIYGYTHRGPGAGQGRRKAVLSKIPKKFKVLEI